MDAQARYYVKQRSTPEPRNEIMNLVCATKLANQLGLHTVCRGHAAHPRRQIGTCVVKLVSFQPD